MLEWNNWQDLFCNANRNHEWRWTRVCEWRRHTQKKQKKLVGISKFGRICEINWFNTNSRCKKYWILKPFYLHICTTLPSIQDMQSFKSDLYRNWSANMDNSVRCVLPTALKQWLIFFNIHIHTLLYIQSDHLDFAGDENVCQPHAVWDDGIPATYHANVNLTSTHKSWDKNNPQLPHHTDADTLI